MILIALVAFALALGAACTAGIAIVAATEAFM
jgi:hypothetical protein